MQTRCLLKQAKSTRLKKMNHKDWDNLISFFHYHKEGESLTSAHSVERNPRVFEGGLLTGWQVQGCTRDAASRRGAGCI